LKRVAVAVVAVAVDAVDVDGGRRCERRTICVEGSLKTAGFTICQT
jgi:hypothetical protein